MKDIAKLILRLLKVRLFLLKMKYKFGISWNSALCVIPIKTTHGLYLNQITDKLEAIYIKLIW